MSHATSVVDLVAPPAPPRAHSPLLFQSLAFAEPERSARRRGAMLAISVVLHSALVLAVVIVPLLAYDSLPSQDALKAFFVAPLEMAAPPPPPPPPPAAARAIANPAPKVEVPQQGFVAPIEVPDVIAPEQGLDLGIDTGVAGGVEGGVPGGVVGGIVGGLPSAMPPPPPRVVRLGGQLAPPRLLRRVEPKYPDLALQSRVGARVVVEAEVDVRGYVKSVKVVSGHPLFDESAMQAVQQWRYQPLLLNGEPTGFILMVTLTFNLRS